MKIKTIHFLSLILLSSFASAQLVQVAPNPDTAHPEAVIDGDLFIFDEDNNNDELHEFFVEGLSNLQGGVETNQIYFGADYLSGDNWSFYFPGDERYTKLYFDGEQFSFSAVDTDNGSDGLMMEFGLSGLIIKDWRDPAWPSTYKSYLNRSTVIHQGAIYFVNPPGSIGPNHVTTKSYVDSAISNLRQSLSTGLNTTDVTTSTLTAEQLAVIQEDAAKNNINVSMGINGSTITHNQAHTAGSQFLADALGFQMVTTNSNSGGDNDLDEAGAYTGVMTQLRNGIFSVQTNYDAIEVRFDLIANTDEDVITVRRDSDNTERTFNGFGLAAEVQSWVTADTATPSPNITFTATVAHSDVNTYSFLANGTYSSSDGGQTWIYDAGGQQRARFVKQADRWFFAGRTDNEDPYDLAESYSADVPDYPWLATWSDITFSDFSSIEQNPNATGYVVRVHNLGVGLPNRGDVVKQFEISGSGIPKGNKTYSPKGILNGKQSWAGPGSEHGRFSWINNRWEVRGDGELVLYSNEDVDYPWEVKNWIKIENNTYLQPEHFINIVGSEPLRDNVSVSSFRSDVDGTMRTYTFLWNNNNKPVFYNTTGGFSNYIYWDNSGEESKWSLSTNSSGEFSITPLSSQDTQYPWQATDFPATITDFKGGDPRLQSMDLVQNDISLMPIIVDQGGLIEEGGQPVMQMQGKALEFAARPNGGLTALPSTVTLTDTTVTSEGNLRYLSSNLGWPINPGSEASIDIYPDRILLNNPAEITNHNQLTTKSYVDDAISTLNELKTSDGSTALTVGDSGNIGIGNAAPSYALDVDGQIRTTQGVVLGDGTTITSTDEFVLLNEEGLIHDRNLNNEAPLKVEAADSGAAIEVRDTNYNDGISGDSFEIKLDSAANAVKLQAKTSGKTTPANLHLQPEGGDVQIGGGNSEVTVAGDLKLQAGQKLILGNGDELSAAPPPSNIPTETKLIEGGGALFTGAFGGGATFPTEAEGAGARMFWYPEKGAFRAGVVSSISGWGIGSQSWDNIFLGNYSVAFGESTIAQGDYSFAAGFQAYAQGNFSFAQGYATRAHDSASVALGLYTNAYQQGSLVVGWNNRIDHVIPPLFEVGNGVPNGNPDDRASAFTVLPNGRVGIGEINPEATLHVKGTIRIDPQGDILMGEFGN